MKKLIIGALVVLSSMPAIASYNTSAESGLRVDTTGRVHTAFYLNTCSSYKDVGVSSFFGTPEDYDKPYPELGRFHAELQRVNGFSASNKSFIHRSMKEAHEYQYNMYRGLAQNTIQFKRYEKMIKEYPDTYAMQKQKYHENRTQVIKQRKYNIKKTINDINNQLDQAPPQHSNGNSSNSQTDWELYLECKRWWQYEEELEFASQNSGRY